MKSMFETAWPPTPRQFQIDRGFSSKILLSQNPFVAQEKGTEHAGNIGISEKLSPGN